MQMEYVSNELSELISTDYRFGLSPLFRYDSDEEYSLEFLYNSYVR